MVNNEQLIDALNTCIDQLNAEVPLETVLQDYPELANQLRPMLEVGLVSRRARYPLPDVMQAQQQIDPRIQATIDETFSGGMGLSSAWWGVLVVVILIAGGALFFGGFNVDQWLMGAPTATHTPTATATATPQPTATVTNTPAPSVTATPQPTATSTELETRTIITGPVSAVQDNAITIYDHTLTLTDDDPRLSVLQVGDVVQVTLAPDASTQVIELVFISVTVLFSEAGEVWRGDNCNLPPPAWVVDGADNWYVQCRPANTTTNPNNNPPPSSGGQDNDDDDDGDDDD
ncbi:MAG: hypothetical protein ACFE0Q_00485 [Anaerolineae bacterium]